MAPLDLVPIQLSDRDLLAEISRLVARERAVTADLVALLAEVDARRLHLAEGCSSLFVYCTERLHLSEHAAYHRIEAARAVRAFPVILDHLRAGLLTLTAVTLLRPHLTAGNHEHLLAAACGLSKREVEVLVRGVAPLPDVRASVRRLPAGSSADRNTAVPRDCPQSAAETVGAAAKSAVPPSVLAAFGDVNGPEPCAVRAPSLPAAVHVLAPERYSLRVTLSADGHARLRRAQDLLRHALPDGDPAAIVERALALLVDRLERTKFALRPGSTRPQGKRRDAPRRATPGKRAARTIPSAVKRAVWERDEGRCAFKGGGGRCRETARLEFHHRIPVADGGPSSVDNVELLCTAHHAHESRRWFGEAVLPDPAA